jgi:hypothetical protein
MVLIWIGVLLVIGGVLYTAAQAIWRGRLSRTNAPQTGSDTLEPPAQERGSGLGLGKNWPGLAMIAVGFILLLAGAGS